MPFAKGSFGEGGVASDRRRCTADPPAMEDRREWGKRLTTRRQSIADKKNGVERTRWRVYYVSKVTTGVYYDFISQGLLAIVQSSMRFQKCATTDLSTCLRCGSIWQSQHAARTLQADAP